MTGAGSELIEDPIVLQAMMGLTSRPNPADSTFGSTDPERVLQTFVLLLFHGHSLNAEELARWARTTGWTADGTVRLRALLSEAQSGNVRRMTERLVDERSYTYWKDQAQQ